jgi:hypothetical protein
MTITRDSKKLFAKYILPANRDDYFGQNKIKLRQQTETTILDRAKIKA